MSIDTYLVSYYIQGRRGRSRGRGCDKTPREIGEGDLLSTSGFDEITFRRRRRFNVLPLLSRKVGRCTKWEQSGALSLFILAFLASTLKGSDVHKSRGWGAHQSKSMTLLPVLLPQATPSS